MPLDPTNDLGPPGQVAGLKAFRPGEWNGETNTARDVADMAAAFAEYAAADPPVYLPYVSINHDDGLAFGRVTAARVLPDATLELDLDGVPLAVRDWMRSDRLTAPSIEYWEANQFVRPDGTPDPRKVLKCVTLLGNAPPGVKGLPPLSAAKFADRSTVRFSDLPTATKARAFMDRTTMIKALADAGIPADGLDGLPDGTLKAMVDVSAKAAKAMADDNDEDDKKKEMEDKKGEDDEVKKYRDKAKKAATEAETLVAALKAQTAAATATAKQMQDRVRAERVKLFRDEMTGANGGPAFMTPAQFDAVEPLLHLLDHTTVKKFADGKTDGTALDEQIAKIKAAHPTPVKKFGHQLADGKATTVGAGGHNYTAPPARSELSPEALKMLDSTPEGRAAVARLAK